MYIISWIYGYKQTAEGDKVKLHKKEFSFQVHEHAGFVTVNSSGEMSRKWINNELATVF